MEHEFLIFRMDAQGTKRILNGVDTEAEAQLGARLCEKSSDRNPANTYGWESNPKMSACVGCAHESGGRCGHPTVLELFECFSFVSACVWREAVEKKEVIQ